MALRLQIVLMFLNRRKWCAVKMAQLATSGDRARDVQIAGPFPGPRRLAVSDLPGSGLSPALLFERYRNGRTGHPVTEAAAMEKADKEHDDFFDMLARSYDLGLRCTLGRLRDGDRVDRSRAALARSRELLARTRVIRPIGLVGGAWKSTE